MKEYTPEEFYELCTEDQKNQLFEILDIMRNEDVPALMAGMEHIEKYVGEIMHFLKLSGSNGLIYIAVDMDYRWVDGLIVGTPDTFYLFKDAGELELRRYQEHTTAFEGANPLLN